MGNTSPSTNCESQTKRVGPRHAGQRFRLSRTLDHVPMESYSFCGTIIRLSHSSSWSADRQRVPGYVLFYLLPASQLKHEGANRKANGVSTDATLKSTHLLVDLKRAGTASIWATLRALGT